MVCSRAFCTQHCLASGKGKVERFWHRLVCIMCRLLAAMLCLVLSEFLFFACMILMLLVVIIAVELG